MSNYIKNLVKTAGWQEVEDIFDKAVTNLENSKIDEKMPAKQYKTVHLANKKAADTIKKIINKIKLQGRDIKQTTTSYK